LEVILFEQFFTRLDTPYSRGHVFACGTNFISARQKGDGLN
jgi:hypothetical protein